jgi:uncharacterized protein YlxW (UPF0749 family)
MNPFEFVLALVFIVGVFSFLKTRAGIRHRWEHPAEDTKETLRLREEVKQLQERLKVLERITVEKENSLAKEIDALRDR